MKSIVNCLKKALRRMGEWMGFIKPIEEMSAEERDALKLNAKINLGVTGNAGRTSPSIVTPLLLLVLLAGAVYVELHLLALFLGLALVCALISYVTVQQWIDLAGGDHTPPSDEPPAWRWPRAEDFGGNPI